MRFANPLFLFALAIIPVLYRFMVGERKTSAILFSDSDYAYTAMRINRYFFPVRFGLRAAAVAVVVVCLARPQTEKGYELVKTEGIDIMMALDISGSMRAEDFKPLNRITVAKQVVADFVSKINNDRVGLVVFAAKSFTRCPLTLDYSVFKNLLEEVDVGMIEDGTAIGLALANSVARLKDSKAKSKVIILVTDGVNNRGEIDPLTGASLAQAAGIKVYTIGVGREGGAPVPIIDQFGRKRYATNPDGSLYLTEIDEDTLKKIASITGGRYYRATDEKALEDIYSKILEMEKSELEVKRFKQYRELAPLLLPFALLALFAEILLTNTWWRRIP